MTIEKRIGYQDGKGVHDPLAMIVLLMSKRASPGGLSADEEKELNRLIEKTGYVSQKARGGSVKKEKKEDKKWKYESWAEVPHDTEPGYIDPKELQDIFQSLPVSEMVKLNPGAYEYMMQRYYHYLHSPGDTSLSFRDFVRDYFRENLDDLKKGGLVK